MDPGFAAQTRDRLLAKMEQEHKRTLAVIEHLPEDRLDYTPHPQLRPFGEMAAHIYRAGDFFVGFVDPAGESPGGPEAKPAPPATKPELLSECVRLHRELVARIGALTPEGLVQEVPFLELGTFPAIQFLELNLNHIIHHRAQLAVYLRMMGAKVPAIYGDSRDYPLFG